MPMITDEQMKELHALQRRVGIQRREIRRLKELTDHLVLCRECIYFKGHEGGAHFCERIPFVNHSVMEDGFCSEGQRLPILEKIGTRLR